MGSQRVQQDLATNTYTFKYLLFTLETSLSYPALLPAKSTCLHLMKPLCTSREFFTAFLHGSQSSATPWKFCTSWRTFSAVLPWIHFQLTASMYLVILCSRNNILPVLSHVPSLLCTWWISCGSKKYSNSCSVFPGHLIYCSHELSKGLVWHNWRMGTNWDPLRD